MQKTKYNKRHKRRTVVSIDFGNGDSLLFPVSASLVLRKQLPALPCADGRGDGCDFPSDLQGTGCGRDGDGICFRRGDHAGG